MSSYLKKPFCKVCFDAGKPESTYTNHYVKNVPGQNGKVVCPTLLDLNCRYCLKNGHTVSHCPDLAQNNKKKNFMLIQKNLTRLLLIRLLVMINL